MDKETKRKLADKLKRNKYVLLVVAAGILILLLPTSTSKKSATATDTATAQQTTAADAFSTEEQEQKLEDALSQIQGAGNVTVLLTVKTSAEQVLAENGDRSSDGTESSESEEMVIVSDSDGGESAVTVKTIAPEYSGALVVAEGAADASVKLKLLEAVKAVTGLSSDKITVTN